MFKITEFHEAHLASVTNRVEKHGDDDKPAISLKLELTMANTILDQIDPALRHSLFKRKDDQPDLPGLEESTPVLRCNSIDQVALPTKQDGWTLCVDDGIDDTAPMVFGGVKLDKFSVEPKQGGSIVLRLRAGTSDVDAERLGALGMHNGQSIWVTLTPPKPGDTQAAAGGQEMVGLFDEDDDSDAGEPGSGVIDGTDNDDFPEDDQEEAGDAFARLTEGDLE